MRRLLPFLLLIAAHAAAMPVLDVSGTSFRFAIAPGGNPPSQNFRIFNRGDGVLKPVVTIPVSATWLNVSLTSNGGTISVASSALAAGSYNAMFTISDPAAADSPRSINVQLNVTSVLVTEPASLAITVPVGTSTYRDVYLPYQSVPTGNIPEWLPATSNGGNWLTLSLLAESGVYIRATIAGNLAEGTYSGAINYRYQGVIVGSTPITLTVTSKPIVSATPASVSIDTSPGLAVPDQIIQVTNLQSALSDSPWISTFQNGNALRLVFSTAKLTPGTYQGSVTVNSALKIPVTLNLIALGAPAVKIGGAVDGANYCIRANCYLAPGSLATLFGTQMAYSATSATTTPLPTTLGTTRVLVNGTPAELLYVAYGQVNFRLPATPPSSTKWIISVTRDGAASNVVSAPYTSSAPAIFSADASGVGYGAILRAGEGVVADTTHPVTRGNYVEIYATGLGSTLTPPTVLFSGAGITGNVETTPSYAGTAPGFVGLYQINVQIPATLPASDHVRVQLHTSFNLLSNAVEIAVR